MKKLLSIILSIILIFSFSAVAFAGNHCENTPVIMVSGFGGTTLVRTNDDGTEEAVFPPSTDGIINIVKSELPKLASSGLQDFVYSVIADVLDPISATEDGKSVYNLRPIYSTPEDTSYDGFVKNDATSYIPYADSDFLDMKSAAEKLGGDHVFNFLYDWRLSGDELANQFLEYIEAVRQYTGHDKVSVYCLSQGSVPVAQYLYKYADKGYIENMVFDNPIFDGSNFVSDILGGRDNEFNFNLVEIVDLLENIIHVELNLSEIVSAIPNGEALLPKINALIKGAAEDVIFPIAKNSAAYVEMIPTAEFDRVVAEYYTNEEIVAEAMKVINGYRSDIEGTLRNAMDKGIDISIVSCSGFDLVTGTAVQSDAIVNLESSCGAYCAEKDTTFPTDYVQKVNTGKNNISPDRTIDLSCGYVPERTWIVNERYHGQCEWGPNSLALIENLLYTDDLADAYSSYEFPQFIQNDDYNHDIWASFAETNSLYGIKDSTGILKLKNTSSKSYMLITDITADGESVLDDAIILGVGESVTVKLDTTEIKCARLVVTYSASDAVFSEKTREFGYSVTDNYSGITQEAEEEEASTSILKTILSTIWKTFLSAFKYVVNFFSTSK